MTTGADPIRPAPDALLDHADRMWKAEEVNAARLTTRTNFVLVLVVGTVVVLLRSLDRQPPTRVVALDTAVLAASLLALFRSIAVLLIIRPHHVPLVAMAEDTSRPLRVCLAHGILGRTRPRRRSAAPQASDLLEPSPDEVAAARLIDDASWSWIVYGKTASAAAELKRKNIRRTAFIDEAQVYFVVGFSLALAYLIV